MGTELAAAESIELREMYIHTQSVLRLFGWLHAQS